MRCVVIRGTATQGATNHLKEMFLEALQPEAVTEFCLPTDAPAYCTGCQRCFLESESKCPHVEQVEPIWQAMLTADLIVFVYPVYVMRAPGAVKSLLDHFGVHWFAHRPEPAMFDKTAVLLTQSAGAPNGAAQKDVKTSLEWMGISRIHRLGFRLAEGVSWHEVSEKRKEKFASKIRALADRIKTEKKPTKSLKTRLLFAMCRKMQSDTAKKRKPGQTPSVDLQYWIDRGWVQEAVK